MIPGSRHWVLIWGLYGTNQNQFRKNKLLGSLSHVGLYDEIFRFFQSSRPKTPKPDMGQTQLKLKR